MHSAVLGFRPADLSRAEPIRFRFIPARPTLSNRQQVVARDVECIMSGSLSRPPQI